MTAAGNNINKLIAALRLLEKKNLSLLDQSDLLIECEIVFQKLGKSREFDPYYLDKTIEFLENQPENIKEIEIDELENEESLEEEAQEKPESKLDKLTIDELVAEYEKAKSEAEKKEIANKITKKTGKHNVEDFIRRQKEIAQERAKKSTAELVA